MQVDERVEGAVREAYRAVIAKDGDRLAAAFAGLNEDEAQMAVRYAVFVVGFIVKDVFRNGATEAELSELADKIIASESPWVDLGRREDLARLLAAATSGNIVASSTARADVVGNILVVGGFLLTSFRLDDQRWWDYLDEIWAAMEAAG
ncbi:hypothetical protein ACGGAQ_12370 [Micromonospora sp. NPDC047557]|uniref:hypothetical protein n=1 Tax=Micromonospora sp. NPDC047557 TaxID=3364250 RepID=UPI0037211806